MSPLLKGPTQLPSLKFPFGRNQYQIKPIQPTPRRLEYDTAFIVDIVQELLIVLTQETMTF